MDGEGVDAVFVGGLRASRSKRVSADQHELRVLTCGGPKIVPFHSFISRSSESYRIGC